MHFRHHTTVQCIILRSLQEDWSPCLIAFSSRDSRSREKQKVSVEFCCLTLLERRTLSERLLPLVPGSKVYNYIISLIYLHTEFRDTAVVDEF